MIPLIGDWIKFFGGVKIMKKNLSVALAILLILTLTGCIKTPADTDTDNINQNTTASTQPTTTSNADNTTNQAIQTPDNSVNSPTEAPLSKAEIISTYINAAKKTTDSVVSVQNISLNSITINDGSGFANSIINMVKPIISGVVSANSTEFSGITGGYENMAESDVKFAEIKTNGTTKSLKLTMNEQTDTVNTDINSGSVGHAISVIGDLSSVMGQLSDSGLPLEISDENISMTYKNAYVNVTIDENGNIINGTWCYTVTINLTNFTVAGSTVDKTSVEILNTITFNNGFAE